MLLRGAIDVERVEGTRRTGDKRKLAPGEALTVPIAGPLGAVETQAPAETGSSAMLTFDNTSLRDAVEAINRRNSRKIVVDATTPDETITGGFNSGDPDSFPQLIASMFNLDLTRGANGELLLGAARNRRSGDRQGLPSSGAAARRYAEDDCPNLGHEHPCLRPRGRRQAGAGFGGALFGRTRLR